MIQKYSISSLTEIDNGIETLAWFNQAYDMNAMSHQGNFASVKSGEN